MFAKLGALRVFVPQVLSRRPVLRAPFRMMFYISTSEQKEIKTLFLSSHFNSSKKKQKQNGTLGLIITI